MDNVINAQIKKEIRGWRKVSKSKMTPKREGEGFDDGWRLGINRVCNSIERIMNKRNDSG